MSASDHRRLLLVEGVNRAAVIADTQDLSTARGGSLLLLQAIDRIEKKLETTAISKGASVGIFALPQKTPTEAAATRDEVEGWLAGTKPPEGDNVTDVLQLTPYATFMVETVARTATFAADLEALTAKSRWRRMQSPNLAYPFDDARKVPCDASGPEAEAIVCGTHAAAPAMPEKKRFKGDEQRYVSRGVWQRRGYGRKQKQAFYRDFLGDDLPKNNFTDTYANDLDEIACLSETDKKEPGDVKRQIGGLDGKIAILFADGNGFSKRRRALVEKLGQVGLETWDSKIIWQRKKLLAGLLNRLHGHGPLAYRCDEAKTERRLRLETLLFAGDDTLWILPAWLGLDAARFFFADTEGWRGTESDDAPLTHAIGLVFCHHNAPIHRVTDLAERLARTAKGDRKTNCLAIEVLESFDHPGTDFAAYRRGRTPAAMRPDDWLLDPAGLDAAIRAAKQLIGGGLPRRQLRRHAMAVASGSPNLDDTRKGLERSFPGTKAAFDEAVTDLESCLGPEPWLWLHLETLYDYLAATP